MAALPLRLCHGHWRWASSALLRGRRCLAASTQSRDKASSSQLAPAHFFGLLQSHGTKFFAGVPDSLMKDVCDYITDKTVAGQEHMIAANEGTALAVAAGHHLATGRVPCVYLQNSGLGNTVNPLLSLCSTQVYSIPVLLLLGWRGEPGTKDEPQHKLQGELTPKMLETMRVPFEALPADAEAVGGVLERAYAHLTTQSSPFALLVRKGTFEKYSAQCKPSGHPLGSMKREDVLELVVKSFPGDVLVTTTGYTSRELFELRKRRKESHRHDFLTVGSMGHSSSIALGIATEFPERQVVCVDGDGAALMHLGALATIGKAHPPNFKHILINNAVHDSVGGQPTGCEDVDFPAVAVACRYRGASSVSSASDVESAVRGLRDQSGPYLLEIRALRGTRPDLGRPTTSTHENKREFMEFLETLKTKEQ